MELHEKSIERRKTVNYGKKPHLRFWLGSEHTSDLRLAASDIGK